MKGMLHPFDKALYEQDGQGYVRVTTRPGCLPRMVVG